MTEKNKKELKAAIEAGLKDFAVEFNGKSYNVIVGGKVKLPTDNEEARQNFKPLYDACRRIRDNGGKGTWEGIEVPPMYWPEEGQKRGEGTTSTPSKPLFKVTVGTVTHEFDKSDAHVLQDVLAWVEGVVKAKVKEYNDSLINVESNKEYVALLSDIKPIAALQLEDTVKVSMIIPLLQSKGYKQVTELANNLLAVASKKEGVVKDFTLLEKVEG